MNFNGFFRRLNAELFASQKTFLQNRYSFAAVRGSSYGRTSFRKRKKCNEIFLPNINIIETRRALFLKSARKATQDLRHKLKEKERHRRYLNDLNPLDVKACISCWEKPTKFNPSLTVHRYNKIR